MTSSTRIAPGSLTRFATATTVSRQARQIDEIHLVARQLGIKPGGVGYVADQPVEPADVVLYNRQQTLARFGVRATGRVSTALRGGERVFNSCATSAAKRSIASMRS